MVTFQEIPDMSNFAAPFGCIAIFGEGTMEKPVKANTMRQMGHFGIFVGLPQGKGFLMFSLVTLKVKNEPEIPLWCLLLLVRTTASIRMHSLVNSLYFHWMVAI